MKKKVFAMIIACATAFIFSQNVSALSYTHTMEVYNRSMLYNVDLDHGLRSVKYMKVEVEKNAGVNYDLNVIYTTGAGYDSFTKLGTITAIDPKIAQTIYILPQDMNCADFSYTTCAKLSSSKTGSNSYIAADHLRVGVQFKKATLYFGTLKSNATVTYYY